MQRINLGLYAQRALSVFLVLLLVSCNAFNFGSKKKEKGNLVLISTNMGDMKVFLYDETPLHKANFLRLVDSSYYDNMLFHRVIKGFMIQGGDPNSRNAPPDRIIGSGGPGYTIPAEISRGLIHKKGALAGAREGDQANPEKRSSGSQFYIVQGQIYPKSEMDNFSQSIDYNTKMKCLQDLLYSPEHAKTLAEIQRAQQNKQNIRYDSLIHSFDPLTEAYLDSVGRHQFTEYQKEIYSTIGGAPHLDGGYTVFGELVEGMDVLDRIAALKTNQFDRPMQDVVIFGMKRVKK